MQISQSGLRLIESFEGLELHAYQDEGGVWTIGYGTTAGAGVHVAAGMTCTQEQAQTWLKDYVNGSCVPAIAAAQAARLKSVGWRTRFNQNQVDALASFAYNLGAGILSPAHTIGADIRRGKTKPQIAQDLMMYVDVNGRPDPGLINRRTAERNLFLRRPVKK